jgi:methylthioribose-1-phosphate isomerase
MQVRGAPAIAIVAMLALASELTTLMATGDVPAEAQEARHFISEKLHYLVTSRPTAVNLSDAVRKLETLITDQAQQPGSTGQGVATAFIRAAEEMLGKDLEDNQRIGEHGAAWIMAHASAGSPTVAILTHCNTG